MKEGWMKMKGKDSDWMPEWLKMNDKNKDIYISIYICICRQQEKERETHILTIGMIHGKNPMDNKWLVGDNRACSIGANTFPFRLNEIVKASADTNAKANRTIRLAIRWLRSSTGLETPKRRWENQQKIQMRKEQTKQRKCERKQNRKKTKKTKNISLIYLLV